MAPNKLIFVTGNANKLREVREILGDVVELESRAMDLPELQGTIEEISKDKCRRAADAVSLNPKRDGRRECFLQKWILMDDGLAPMPCAR
jgi:inosine/xanthosine triphosphate pyrophosphatase family protein